MKIRIELDDSLTEEEVIIRCNSISEKVQKMQMALSEIENAQEKMVLYKKETEYYVKLDDILFFETGINGIEAHTKNDIFGHSKWLDQHKVLVYHTDSDVNGILRAVEMNLFFIDKDLSTGRFVQSAEHIHHGALSGSVLTEESMDLTFFYCQVDILICIYAGK